MPRPVRALLPALLLAGLAFPTLAQTTAMAQTGAIALNGLKQDSSLPVQVTADQLAVDQATAIATFSGNVVIVQGGMKLSADQVKVEYLEAAAGARGKINRLLATGHVLLVTPTEAAEAAEAVYSVADARIVMTGDVVLTQGDNALSGQKLTVNLTDGTATVEGRVTTTLQTGGAAP